MNRRFLLSVVLVAAGFVAGLIVTGPARTLSNADAAAAAQPQAIAQPQRALPNPGPQVPAPAVVGGPDFTKIAGQSVRGVANISSVQVVRRQSSPLDDPFFRYFFGDADDMYGSRDRRSLSLGSGVIVSADGYVVTNNHVVGEDVRDISVALGDKRELPGQLIGTDPATDIALIKIDVTGLPTVPWGDSDRLQVGEWVLAIGSPFQLSQTVTAGIVSATRRSNVGFAEYEDFIQTDAAINPGNSGGALINSRGELVGINTGIFSQSGGYQGIGFAVPSNLVRHVVDDLQKFGAVRRGSIGGVAFDRLSPRLAEELNLQSTVGAVVVRMQRSSQAYQAGIRPGDVIVAFNGQPVADPSQLNRMLADAPPGRTATIRITREGRTLELRVPVVSDER
ncbi:MAG: trypsin-like serine protease [Luteitalea sp.]|nr:trypsin-like serine protease [Luteitalea sp.]